MKKLGGGKEHKERRQPSARQDAGFLQKKKDWRKRLAAFKDNENQVKGLRTKAFFRNPDEFYFKMNNTKIVNNQIVSTKVDEQSPEDAFAEKTRDLNYITLKKTADMKKTERLQSELHGLGAPPKNEHIIFVDDALDVLTFDAEKHFDTPKELGTRVHNRLRTEQLASASVLTSGDGLAMAQLKKMEKEKMRRYQELADRTESAKSLEVLMSELEQQRAVNDKSLLSKKVVQRATETRPAVLRFKMSRKK